MYFQLDLAQIYIILQKIGTQSAKQLKKQMNFLLDEKLQQMRIEQLTNMLRCPLCKGLYRLAHTIFGCGHTFCYSCILEHIKSFKGKNPPIKCPKCHQLLDSNYKKSLFKDNYKQQLVDTLAPQYSQIDTIIIERVQTLFPKYDLKFIIQDFTHVQNQQRTQNEQKYELKAQITARLPQKVQQKFGITFQEFAQQIKKQQNFIQMSNTLKQLTQPRGSINQQSNFVLKAKTQRDFRYVGIQNQMKIKNITAQKLQRFLQKKALIKITQSKQIPPQWMNEYDDSLKIKLCLEIGQIKLQQEHDLMQILNQSKSNTIQYSIQSNY